MSERVTQSGIPLKPLYTPADTQDIEYEAALGDPGSFPYTRGRRLQPAGAVWIQRELSGEGDPRRSNEQFKYLLSKGQIGVDVIGLSAHSWEYLHYIDEVLAGLREHGLDVPVVVGGSVITPNDTRALLEKGVAGAFGPSSTTQEVVRAIAELADAPGALSDGLPPPPAPAS
jgi:methylmalonyl-CoA mutase N-terminal domain/subunit